MLSISTPSDYSSRIRQLRIKFGLTQTRLADLLGVSFVTVNRWENGQSRPSAQARQQITLAEKFGIEALSRDYVEPEVVREPEAVYGPNDIPNIDFSADPEVVRVIAEGERLTYGHLFNAAFATEISLIDPLPHQRIAVYEHMLAQPRLRFLLADDAGAGKTIMTGLYVREMLSRRLIRRVLIVPPAGLLGNWEREMHTLFRLPFRIVTGTDARSANPFVGPESDLLIISVDTLSAERAFTRLQETAVTPYDLVIFDEAHKLSADREPDFTIRKIDRYRLAEAVAGIQSGDLRWSLDWSCQHLLLLTATPHMGKDFPYYCLWRLLEPDILSTVDAFNAFPADARKKHFIRRTKEEMVRFDGSRIYPTRISDTLSYDLTQGEISEQALYDQTTDYLRTFYNRARILNRSAARLAMSIFQRRLASSTYALLRSFERRLDKLDGLIEDIESGKLTAEGLLTRQRHLDEIPDVLDEATGDEEEAEEGREENEVVEERVLGGVVAVSLAELQAERNQVKTLRDLAQRVYDQGEESKFEKLREVLRDPRFKDQKILIFTEHRDTLHFLVRRLEGLGFASKVAQIHGGMDYREREEQVAFFRKPAEEGGATYLIGTDAAGEGINLQFSWLMINYDIPWNPARLEQRMGRIHRYGQKHDPVLVMNLVAGKTREGRVLATLLNKLERIRRELGSDKVFDVIGRFFEGVSLKEYMERSVTEEGTRETVINLEGKLTKEQIQALQEKERRLFGDGGDVSLQLPAQRVKLEHEELRHLLPGYVRRFIEKAAPLVDIGIEGDPDGLFSLKPLKPYALDPLLPTLEMYPAEQRNRFTVYKPRDASEEAIFLHPGEPFFERLRDYVWSRFSLDALKGGVFIDPYATRPYIFHLALAAVSRKSDLNFRLFARKEILDCRLIGLRDEELGQIEECPVEQLLLLKGGSGVPISSMQFASTARRSRDAAQTYSTERLARPLAEERRKALLESLPERETFVTRGYDYQDAELAAMRARLTEKARAGDPKAKGDLTKIKERQRAHAARRDETLASLRREPDLVASDEVIFLAHALVIPSSDPEDRRRHDDQIEAIAVGVAWAYEEANGAAVKDVSTPERARTADLTDRPGFDILSLRSGGEERAIEVKGRAGIGDIEVTDNEWAKACNLRGRYWLYVVFECSSAAPRLLRIQDPFSRLLATTKGGVIIDEKSVFCAAEPE
ncbi:MAG: DUF3883 domain-containing protein [Acidobacteria bacterium]|nr:DUF3883 domain-containing protein [Acidobacteriota bacterium]